LKNGGLFVTNEARCKLALPPGPRGTSPVTRETSKVLAEGAGLARPGICCAERQAKTRPRPERVRHLTVARVGGPCARPALVFLAAWEGNCRVRA